jgi:ABC-type branched-subunit amino acid transport system substrate-binding protein
MSRAAVPTRRNRSTRSAWRIAGGAGAALAALAIAMLPGGGVVARADTLSTQLAVDGQDYAPVSPFPDVYQQDVQAVHIGVTAGRPTYYAYVHVALDAVPPVPGERLTLTLGSFSDTKSNVNTSAAILSMCVLADHYPKTFDSSNPPRYDCTKGSTVGTAKPDGSWSFDATRLLAAWRVDGDTGAAIIPEYQPTDSWEIAFDKTLTVAGYTATVSPPAPTLAPTLLPYPSTTPVPVAVAPPSLPAATAVPTAVPSPTPVPTPKPTPRPHHAVVPAGGTSGTGGGTAGAAGDNGALRWAVVLVLSTIAALLLVGRPLMRAVQGAAGSFRRSLRSEMHHHPRAFTLASVLLGWSVAFSGYSVASTTLASTGMHRPLASAQQDEGGSTGEGGGSGGGPGASTTGPAATNQPGSPAAPGSVGPVIPGASSGGGTGSGPTQTPFNGYGVNLFGPDRDRIGIDDNTIKLCGHSALIFGPAFDVSAKDINVFWQYVNGHGGINGRQVSVEWIDDQYAPDKAVQAAQKCEDDGAFAILSGIGFDQIPAVRVWAEQHQELYLYHIAVQQGSQGMRYSYTELPSVEQVGRQAGDLAVSKYRGHKIAIIERQSPNWEPGANIFKQMVTAAGGQITDDEYVSNNQSSYTTNLVKMENSGADVVLVWENALAATEIIEQAHGQRWYPHMILFPFNLTIQKLQAKDLNPPLDGVAAWTAYTNGDYDNAQQFGYADEVQRFEAAYHQYDSSANLSGFGGDLLWMAWTEFKQVQDLLVRCGRDCTRNKLASVIQGFKGQIAPNCAVDFTADHHHAGRFTDVFDAENRNGRNEWLVTQHCVAP